MKTRLLSFIHSDDGGQAQKLILDWTASSDSTIVGQRHIAHLPIHPLVESDEDSQDSSGLGALAVEQKWLSVDDETMLTLNIDLHLFYDIAQRLTIDATEKETPASINSAIGFVQ